MPRTCCRPPIGKGTEIVPDCTSRNTDDMRTTVWSSLSRPCRIGMSMVVTSATSAVPWQLIQS